MPASREPDHCEKGEAGQQSRITDPMVELSEALEFRESRLQSLAVFRRWIHFSVEQKLFTSEDMLPRSEFKPDPSPNLPPRTERMKVLESSSGRVETFRQKSYQMPSCCKYCSTLDR